MSIQQVIIFHRSFGVSSYQSIQVSITRNSGNQWPI